MRKEKTSIAFTGDIGFDKHMDHRWEDDELLSRPIHDFFHSADHVAANIEGTFIAAPQDGDRDAFYHAMDPAAVRVLRNIHADIWCLGNNHSMDAGREGLISTQMIARERGCLTVGAGLNETEASEPIYLDEAGGIGMFGVTYMTVSCPATATEPGIFRWDDMDYIKRRIDEVKAKCRWCVIVSHGGEEFTSMPSPYTRDRYLRYLELGADVVVAHHPHVPENYELFPDGKAIFYSLGNFIFDTNYQRAHLYTDVGVLLKLIFTEEKLDFEAMGIRIVRGPEKIVEATLPDIFTDIPAGEYALLSPLAAKALLAEIKRKMIHLEPGRFTDASQAAWDDFFLHTKPRSYAAGTHLDFSVLLPFAKTADEGAWKHSKLEPVKQHILRQL